MNNEKKEKDCIIKVKHLSVTFGKGERANAAVQDVTFRVMEGEILGIVGESGSGKSVSSLSIMQLLPDVAKITGGEIIFNGEELLDKTEAEMRKIRGNKISMIFQEPMTSFNPVFTIGKQICEAIMLHQKKSKKEAEELAIELLHEVGISFPEKRFHEYPHQMSGGMLQRAMIAMALSCDPDLLIADEPTTALDVTTQAQILDLLKRLQKERNMSIIMITHDLGVVSEVAKYVVVMYKGRIVEEAQANDLFEKPMHPYTAGLLKSIPHRGDKSRLYMIPPGPGDVKQGCRFYPRCECAMERCKVEEPPLAAINDGTRHVRCWLHLTGEEREDDD